MRNDSISRREMLEWLALGGVLLTGAGRLGAAKETEGKAKYPSAKDLSELEKDGWMVEYRKEDARKEGFGLRAPSVVPPDKFVCTPSLIESQFNAKGKNIIFMPSYASVCNQTCLAVRVEVEADGKPLKKGEDFTARKLVTKPLGNRFWQVTLPPFKDKVPVRVRVLGLVSNPEAPADLAAVKAKIAQRARQDNQFVKRHRVPPSSHWLEKPGEELTEAAKEARGSLSKNHFDTLLNILEYTHKRGKLTKGQSHDPEEYVKDGMKGSCGANADFVNFAAHAAGLSHLFWTEGYVVVPSLNYMGLHVWNTACSNGLFIADSLNPDLYFPQWSGYVATSVGPNVGHPAGPTAATSGGYAKGDYVYDYWIYYSQPNYGQRGKDLAKFEIPEAVRRLGEFVAAQRNRVNRRG